MVEGCSMRNPKTYLLISLFSCLGFIIGFAVCRAFFMPAEEKQLQSTSSLSPDGHPPVLQTRVDKSKTGQTSGIFALVPEQATRFCFRSLEEHDRKGNEMVILENPTYPPQVIATNYPLEDFAKELRITNR